MKEVRIYKEKIKKSMVYYNLFNCEEAKKK